MTRIFPISDWGPAQETMFPESPAEQTPRGGLATTSYLNIPHSSANAPRARSNSLGNLLRRRPRSFLHTDEDFAVAHLSHALPEIRAETSYRWHAQPERPEDSSKLRGILRRASSSLKAKIHRRPGLNMSVSEVPAGEPRPYTAHPTWHKLRQAASFRRPRTPYDAEPIEFPSNYTPSPAGDGLAPLPVPSIGGEPPIIPHNTGAAAKASVAMQNEHLFVPVADDPSPQQPTSHGLQNKRLTHLPADECGNDRESGIGINVAGSVSEADLSDSKRASLQGQDTNISRIDFVTRLPTELAIQVLSHLDCTGLMTAARVSQAWREAVSSQHIWRDSFLREKTATYAMSGPIVPGAGYGVPAVKPTNDWREIYLAREELDRRWRRGEAKPVYLNGHTDSIYCLQFDEYVPDQLILSSIER